MSCCLTFSKFWVGIFSIILLLVAIGIAIISLLFCNFDEIIPSNDYSDINKYIMYGAVGLAFLLAVLSLLGIWLVCKQNKCVSVIYTIEIIILFIVFAGIGVGIFLWF